MHDSGDDWRVVVDWFEQERVGIELEWRYVPPPALATYSVKMLFIVDSLLSKQLVLGIGVDFNKVEN